MTLIARVFHLLTPVERRRAASLLALMGLGSLMELLAVGMVAPFIAVLVSSDLAARFPAVAAILDGLGNPASGELAVIAAGAIMALYVAKTGILAWLAWMQQRFVSALQSRLSVMLFATYMGQPYGFHLDRNSAVLAHNVVSQTWLVTSSVVAPLLLLMSEAMVIVAIVLLLLVAEPAGTIVVATVLSVSALVLHRATRLRLSRWEADRQRHEVRRSLQMHEGLGGVKEARLLGREQTFVDRFAAADAAMTRVSIRQGTLQQMPRLWLELVGVAGLATLLVTVVALGRNVESVVPMLAMFGAAAFRLIPSANRVMGAMHSIQSATRSVDTVARELALAARAGQRPIRSAAERSFGSSVEVRRVGYTYPGAPAPALRDVQISIRAGECVGFVGPSGAGKSTLVDVLLGLLPPSAGEVLVDGRDIRRAERWWQDEIGYVPQTLFIADDTVWRNVAFGVPDERVDMDAVRRAISAAQLDDLVASLPAGLDTTVGERGVRLSGGQRQRLGIARALYHDPSVLVLDEATSSLDYETELEFLRAIDRQRQGRTVIIVSHRETTVAGCDALYRVQEGTVTRQATIRSLVSV